MRPIAPVLTYRLAYRAGYVVTAPMEQLAGERGALHVLVRVTPKIPGAQPLLLMDVGRLPAASGEQNAAKLEMQFTGGFFLGEGEYRAELVLIDSGGRVCRKSWDLELKPRKGVTKLAPGRLTALSQLGMPQPGAQPGGLTVLLNAGTARSNPALLESLYGIVERMPFSRVQIVAFSLEQHKELVRQSVTDGGSMRRVAEALNDYNPQTVPYGVLKDPAGHRNFLWQLLAKEGLRKDPAAAVLFVGYSTFDDSHVLAPPACTDGPRTTVYAYFDYALPAGRRTLPAPEMPDAISRIIHACLGKVYYIHSPSDLASALQKTDELLQRR